MIRSLLKSLLVVAIFVPLAAAFPLAAVALSRTPRGAQVLFWLGPWSCCLYVLVYSQWSSIHAWNRAGRLREWRADHGGMLVTSAKATCWMFFGLFASYVAEAALLFFTRSFTWLPAATYSPLGFVWFWRRWHV